MSTITHFLQRAIWSHRNCLPFILSIIDIFFLIFHVSTQLLCFIKGLLLIISVLLWLPLSSLHFLHSCVSFLYSILGTCCKINFCRIITCFTLFRMGIFFEKTTTVIIRFKYLLKYHSKMKQEHIFTADVLLHRWLRQDTDQHFSYFVDSLLPILKYHSCVA